MLRNSLPVAAAAFAAGQLGVARRLYLSLAERFKDAPEPVLGLGYVEFYDGNFVSAQSNFLQAAEMTGDKPAMKAEALLGAGRAALARGKASEARQILRNAREPGRDAPSAPWIANGLAVAATLDTDYEAAEAHYADADRLSSGDPRITANYVRMLIAAGRIDDAARLHAAHASSYWKDEDGRTLSRLIEAFRQQRPAGTPARPRTRAPGAASEIVPGGSPLSRHAGTTPGRHEPPDPQLDSRPPPPPILELQLSAFAPPPRLTGAGKPVPFGPSDLVLRFADWPGPMTAPTLNGVRRFASFTLPAPEPPSPAPPPPDGTAPGSAPALPLAESEEPVSAPPNCPPPATLTLTLGQSRRLPIDRDATAVSVASPEIADVQLLSPNVLYVIGRSIGRTSIAVLTGEQWSEERIVSVELDLDPLNALLTHEPDFGGVRARRVARGIALAGEVPSAEAADRALRLAVTSLPEGVPIENELRVGGLQQVNLEVQIAEVSRSVTENLGVNWEAFQIRGPDVFGVRIGRLATVPIATPITDRIQNPFPRFPLSPAPPWLELTDAPFSFSPVLVDGQISPSLAFGHQTANTRIGAMVDALATAGLANVLARPNVTAVSGESASFFSGGEFPLPTGFDNGVLVFEYKKFGVLLDFVPTVVDARRIVLTVRPEVSEPSRNQSVQVVAGVNVPVINVRRAETTVEVGNGESIVIAGLFRNASNTVESGVPGLKDVPLLGALFGQTSTRSDELELIVIVTARLVHASPVREGTVAPAENRSSNAYHY